MASLLAYTGPENGDPRSTIESGGGVYIDETLALFTSDEVPSLVVAGMLLTLPERHIVLNNVSADWYGGGLTAQQEARLRACFGAPKK